MYIPDLQSFIKKIEAIGDLNRIMSSVDPYLETAAIINQACKKAGAKKVLLFDRIKGSQVPLIANLFGSENRVAMALGVSDIETLAKQLRDDLKTCEVKDSGHALTNIIQSNTNVLNQSDASSSFVTYVSAPGLNVLPAVHSWPGDGGRYLTLGQVFTRHPDSDRQNCGMYRVQIVDNQTALIRCHPGSGGGAHLAAWSARGLAMPVAITLGGPPALTWCAGVSLPGEVTELEFAAYLTGQAIPVTECQGSNLRVPSTSEFVIEGEILPGEEQLEGPFGNHTGYYSPATLAPVLRIKSVRMREKSVYPCTVVGPPPMENMYLAQAAERLLLPLLQHQYPWVIDIHMPLEGIYHRAALVAVDDHKLSSQDISKALRNTNLLRHARLLVLMDKDIDLRKAADVYWRIINSDDWERSVSIDGDKMTIDARNLSHRNQVYQAWNTRRES